jgi:hypothetical protein
MQVPESLFIKKIKAGVLGKGDLGKRGLGDLEKRRNGDWEKWGGLEFIILAAI